jgi:thymidylate synthase (FAD)
MQTEKQMLEQPIHAVNQDKVLDPLGDGISEIRLLGAMGSDLDVVNDARVSFANKKTELDERDKKLIRYLIKERHTSPLRGIVFKFEIHMPLYIARQWYKHHVASSYKDDQDGWNEISFRYVDATGNHNQFYIPTTFNAQSENNRQAAAGPIADQEAARAVYEKAIQATQKAYEDLRALGVCRQEARGILPAALYTRVRWTVSAQAVLWFVQLRVASGAQTEIQKYAQAIRELVSPIIPETIAAFDEFGF